MNCARRLGSGFNSSLYMTGIIEICAGKALKLALSEAHTIFPTFAGDHVRVRGSASSILPLISLLVLPRLT